jgi:MarR-like DNA-binding transcriptional regulator SgrR of sgrS sRNA
VGPRLIALAAVLMFTSPAMPARAEGRPGYGGAAVGTLLGEPAGFDPVAVRTHADAAIVGLLFDTLYEVGPDGVVYPQLAAALPDVQADRTRITLRPDVHFHDGTPLTAVDVVATLARVRASAAAGWLMVSVTDITVDGDDVVLMMSAPRKDLTRVLATPWTAVTPRGLAPKKDAPIGSGPFRLVAKKKDRLELEAWEGHFAGRPYLDKLTLRWFVAAEDEAQLYETGGAHWSLRGATRFAGGSPKHPTSELESPATLLVYLGFGQVHRDVLTDPDFRAALDAALARSGFSTVGTGERAVPAGDPVPVDLGGPALSAAAADPRIDAAEAALARAGAHVRALAKDRIGALALEILVADSRPDDREVAARVVRALDKLGARATITAVDASDLARRVSAGACDLYIGQATAELSAPAMIYAQAFALAGDRGTADKLASGAISGAKMRETFAARLPIIPLYHRAVRVHHRADLRGAWFDSSARLGVADLFVWPPK